MDKKRKIIIITIVILGIALLVLASWFIYKNFIKNSGKDKTKLDGGSGDFNVDNSSGGSDSQSTSSGGGYTKNPFSSSADVKKFQQYVINTKKDKTILGRGGDSGFGDDGKWGRNTALAWDKYGKDYNPTLANVTTTTPTTSKTFVKGEDVYATLTGHLVLFEYPDSKSSIGYVNIGTTANNCKDKSINHCNFYPIGTFVQYSMGGFTKINLTTKYFNQSFLNSGWMSNSEGKEFYVYNELIKKK